MLPVNADEIPYVLVDKIMHESKYVISIESVRKAMFNMYLNECFPS